MAKELAYGIEARNALVRGVDKVADTVRSEEHTSELQSQL